MDSTISGFRPGTPPRYDSHDSSESVHSSEDCNIDGIGFSRSPEQTRSPPRVFSVNPAQSMWQDRDDRIAEAILQLEGTVATNNLPADRLDKLKAYAAIQKEIKKALAGHKSYLEIYPDELNAVREAQAILEKLINEDIDFYRTGPAKELWTASAGALSYLLTFCTGTLVASAQEMPFLSPVIIGICWTLFERFPPMMRATSWSNVHADVAYPDIMHMARRASQDWLRQLFGLNPKQFMRDGQKMTAVDILKQYDLFKAWSGKVLSDDIPSHTFSLFYIARNVSLRLLTSPGFLATLPGKTVSLCSLALAGLCAGATAALGFQNLRGCHYKAKHPTDMGRGENLVKSTKIWGAEEVFEEKKIALAKKYFEKAKAAMGTGDVKGAAEAMDGALKMMEDDMDRASAKSAFWSSLLYEFMCLFRGRGHFGDNDNGEVAGKLRQTISGFFAKILCLMPSASFITFVVTVFANLNASLVQQLSLLIVAPIVLILGFGFRKELEIIVLAVMGLASGAVDLARYKITNKDRYGSTTDLHKDRKPGLPDMTDGDESQVPESPTTIKLKGQNKPGGRRKDSSSSTSSAEETV